MTVSDKLTKSNVSMVVGACALVFSIFLFVDNRYFHSEAAGQMEIQLAGALKEQMMIQQKFYIDEQRVNDQRQLDQLRCSKSLLESELARNPNDRLTKDHLDRVNKQIMTLENKLSKPPQ